MASVAFREKHGMMPFVAFGEGAFATAGESAFAFGEKYGIRRVQGETWHDAIRLVLGGRLR